MRDALQSGSNIPGAAGVVEFVNPSGAGRVVLVCEHASNFIPTQYANLGLDAPAIASHIAWDPGAMAVARGMAALLDAPLVAQRISRLVYDCNRPPEARDAMPARSEAFSVPGNADLSAADRAARVEAVYVPFREALGACIGRRIAGGRPPALVTVHSFTPVYNGVPRALDLGILHDADARLADAMLGACDDPQVRRNEPYGPRDGVTHTLRVHALAHGLLNVMIEIRNDLIADAASQNAMAARLAALVSAGLAACGAGRDNLAAAGTR